LLFFRRRLLNVFLMRIDMRRLLILSFFSLFFFDVKGQNPSLPTVIQPSPNAASLGKYADIPVGYHTGSVNVSVPIYDVKEGPITIPISLGYHTAGIRVSEISSWVGLGWALNCGGVITRTVQHVPDEGPARITIPPGQIDGMSSGYYKDGYIFPDTATYDPVTPAQFNAQKIFFNAAYGNVDSEPDIFFYNFGGYSGKFFFKVERNESNQLIRTPVFIPRADIKVEVTFENVAVPTHIAGGYDSRETFSRFIITTPDGFKYFFGGGFDVGQSGAVEYTGSASFNQASHPFSNLVKLVPTSWYLTRIVAPNGRRIDLEYESDRYSFFDLATESVSGGNAFLDLGNQMIMRTAIDGRRLSKIKTSTEEISFVANTTREDLSDYENTGGTEEINNITTKKLDRIEVNTLDGHHLRIFDFHQSYFNCSDGRLPRFLELDPGIRSYFVTDKKRLRLDSVVEKSGDLSIINPGHVFKYQETDATGQLMTLPRRMSFQQDHWGYFNGASLNKSLIAFNSEPRNSNREVSEVHSKIGSLTSIQYPTGAVTEFQYENHTTTGLVVDNEPLHDARIYGASTFVFEDVPDVSVVAIDLKFGSPATSSPCDWFGVDCDRVIASISIIAGDPRPVTSNYDLDYSIYSGDMIAGIYQANGTLVRAFFVGDLQNANSADCQLPNCTFYNDPQKYIQLGRMNININLPSGSYYLKAFKISGPKRNDPSKTVMYTASISVRIPADRDVNYTPPATYATTKVGGLRIRKIISKDKSNTVLERDFSYPTTGGVLFSKPTYFYEIKLAPFDYFYYWDHAYFWGFETQTWSSSSIKPMQTTQGSHLGYQNVKEIRPGNGYSKYSYDVALRDFPLQDPYLEGTSTGYSSKSKLFNYPPYPAPFYLERGNLLNHEQFTEQGNIVFRKKSEYESKQYELVGHGTKVELIIAPQIDIQPGSNSGPLVDLPTFTHYPVFSGISRLLKETEATYQPGGDSVLFVKEYKYEGSNHLQVTEVKSTYSNSTELDRMIYPPDYSAITSIDGGIKNLMDNHLISVPIEQYKVRLEAHGNNASVVQGTISTYNSTSLLPDKTKVLNISQPILLNNFQRSNRTSGQFSPDSRYEDKIVFDRYDAIGNLLEVHKNNDIHLAYVWGYNEALPIAEVKNSNSLYIFHTSFEDDTENTSIESRTGRKSHMGVYQLTALPQSPNNLTYWKKVGNGSWELVETTISQDMTIGGPGILVDDVRIFPTGALITTYTYDVGIGMTSSTDPNNVTTYFEYDKLGRLQIVKDDKKRIVNEYTYKYARGN